MLILDLRLIKSITIDDSLFNEENIRIYLGMTKTSINVQSVSSWHFDSFHLDRLNTSKNNE